MQQTDGKIFANTGVMGGINVREAQKEGFREAIKEIIKEKTKNMQRLNTLLSKSDINPLFQLSTFFPLKFFPVHIVINTDRVNITYRDFMRSGQIVTLTVDILQEISVESGPLFSTLILETNKAMEPVVTVKYLKKDEALKARRIIQGLITAKKNDVDLESVPIRELASKLENLGETKKAETPIG